jgi:AcrR family transcriptional regulator
MSKQQNPELPRKLIDALIRTVIEQGFAPGIDAITERAGVSKMSAYAHFTTRPGMTVAALERVGREARKSLEAAVRHPGNQCPGDFNGIPECLVRQLTDHDNPLAFITCCLLGHPDPRSKIHVAARKEHAAISDWLQSHFKSTSMLSPQKVANAVMAVIHGAYANVLAAGIDAWKVVVETDVLLTGILAAAVEDTKR